MPMNEPTNETTTLTEPRDPSRGFKNMRLTQFINMSVPQPSQNSTEPRPAIGDYNEMFLLAERSDGVMLCVQVRVEHQNFTPYSTVCRITEALLQMEEYRTCACKLGSNCAQHANIPLPLNIPRQA